jgi:hypothetical protein
MSARNIVAPAAHAPARQGSQNSVRRLCERGQEGLCSGDHAGVLPAAVRSC